jgi:AcrR family transcriptional regulator
MNIENRQALLEAILRRGMEVMVHAFDAAEEATRGRDGRARIAAHVRAHLAALFEHGPYTAAHVTTFRTAPPAVREAIVPERDAYEAMWTHRLEELTAKGEIDDDTPIGLSRLILFGAMNSSLEWFDPERGTLDDFAATVTDQLWTGVER